MLPAFVATLLIIAAGTVIAGERQPSSFTVLEGHHAKTVSKQCSRDGPPRFDNTWRPTAGEIKELERRLPELQRLKASLCCIKGARISKVQNYHRQYLGLVIAGQQVIYINAFSAKLTSKIVDDGRWKVEPVMACDGDELFWGAIYNPSSKTFSSLAFNGRI